MHLGDAKHHLAKFQSAPRPFGRGDMRGSSRIIVVDEFQSAPRPFGRGDTSGSYNTANGFKFQSAPRPFGRGDREWGVLVTPAERFQSAPRPFGRGDVAPEAGRLGPGRPDHVRLDTEEIRVSIRAPAFRPG
jgi:hypothetical protein